MSPKVKAPSSTNYFELQQGFLNKRKGDIVSTESDVSGPIILTNCGATIPTKLLKKTAAPHKKGGDLLITGGDGTTHKVTKSGTVTKVKATMSGSEKNMLDDILSGGREFIDGTTSAHVESMGQEEEIEPEVKLGKNQIRLSSLTDGRLPASGIDHIIDVFPKTHFSKDVRCDIPEINPNWWWEPNVLETILLGHQEDETTLLVGMPGVGKSDGLKQFAAVIKQPFMRIGCRGDMESGSLLGYPWAESGKMTFKKGLLPQGLEGGHMICIDEVMKMPAPISMVCQELWERNSRQLVLDEMPGSKADKTIKPHENCRLYCTDNVCGTGDNFEKFGATQIQDTSSLDRFGLTERVEYLPESVEVKVLKKLHPKIRESVLKDIVKLAGLIRNGFKTGPLSVTLSMRGLTAMCRLIEKGFSLKAAVDKVYRHKLGTDSELIVLDTSLRTVGIR